MRRLDVQKRRNFVGFMGVGAEAAMEPDEDEDQSSLFVFLTRV